MVRHHTTIEERQQAFLEAAEFFNDRKNEEWIVSEGKKGMLCCYATPRDHACYYRNFDVQAIGANPRDWAQHLVPMHYVPQGVRMSGKERKSPQQILAEIYQFENVPSFIRAFSAEKMNQQVWINREIAQIDEEIISEQKVEELLRDAAEHFCEHSTFDIRIR